MYYTNRHSSYLLQYHLVLITKYRHPVLTGEIEAFLKEYTTHYFVNQNMNIIELEVNNDHIHILFEAPPQICLSSFINSFKSASSRVIRKQFKDELSKYYWKPYFWSLSYFICTVSERNTETVKKYIQNQKK